MHGICNLSNQPIKIKKDINVGKFACIYGNDKVYDVKLDSVKQVGEASLSHNDLY